MTRIRVLLSDGVVEVLVPLCWTDWTMDGKSFRQYSGVIEQQVGTKWRIVGLSKLEAA